MNAETIRFLPKRDYLRGKAVTREAVEAAGGATHVCEISRSSHGRLSEAQSVEHLDRFVPLDVQMDIEAATGVPYFARFLADLAGYDLVARETKASGTDCEQFAGIARETGETLEAFAQALGDGRVDASEVPAIRKALHELLDKVRAVDAALDAKLKVRAVS